MGANNTTHYMCLQVRFHHGTMLACTANRNGNLNPMTVPATKNTRLGRVVTQLGNSATILESVLIQISSRLSMVTNATTT